MKRSPKDHMEQRFGERNAENSFHTDKEIYGNSSTSLDGAV